MLKDVDRTNLRYYKLRRTIVAGCERILKPLCVFIHLELNKKALTETVRALLPYNDILLLVTFTAIGCVLG